MTFWRVHSKARSTRVAIEGTYRGCHGFLVGGSPKLLGLDLRLMNLQGVWSLAINNAATVFESQAFICLDATQCFNYNIFTNPRMLKLFNYSRAIEEVDGRRLCHYPNTLFFDMRDETEMIMSEFCQQDGPLPFWRNTFFTALAAMYQLGFMTVYLIGCGFDIGPEAYALPVDVNDSDKKYNADLYADSIEKMRQLVPMLVDEGMHVSTCHEGTGLEGICPYIEFEDAISDAVIASTSVSYHDIRHANQVGQRND